MGTQIVHHQVDGAGLWIVSHNFYKIVGELCRAAVGSRFGEMASSLGFNSAKDVGRAAPFIFAVAAQNLSRTHRPRRTNIGMQHHWFFVYTGRRRVLRERLFVDGQYVFHAGDELLIQFRNAPHFFPPWLEVMAFQHDADRLQVHRRRQSPLDRFGGDEPHRPPRLALGCRTTYHGDDPPTLSRVQSSPFAWSRLFVQCRFQPFLFVAPGNGSHCLSFHVGIGSNQRRSLPFVKLTKDRSAPQYTRRFTPLGQHRRKLPPIPLSQLNMHPVIVLDVPTMSPFSSAQ